MIIDSHVHLCACGRSPQEQGTIPQTLQALRIEMKNAGVRQALLLPEYRSDNPHQPDTAAACQLVSGMDEFSVVGSFDVEHAQGAGLARLEQLLRTGNIRGLKLYPGYQHFFPADQRCAPLYQLGMKYDVPVIFHSGDSISWETRAKLKYAHPLHLDEVATDFPQLKIIIAHLGNPWITDCAEVLYKNPNVYADLSGLWVGKRLAAGYGRLLRRQIKDLIAYAGAHKLLYGTDWPNVPMRAYLKFIRGLGLPKRDLPRVLYGNAVMLFRLKE